MMADIGAEVLEAYNLFTNRLMEGYNSALTEMRLKELEIHKYILCDSGWDLPSADGISLSQVALAYSRKGHCLGIEYFIKNRKDEPERISVQILIPQGGYDASMVSRIGAHDSYNSAHANVDHTELMTGKGGRRITIETRGIPVGGKSKTISAEDLAFSLEKHRMLLQEIIE